MIWGAPAAWALAVLATLPLVAHLWSRKKPAAMPFPTLRFLRAASPVARRLRRVQEWPLLLLRLAIVVVICAAAAAPTLTARWRQQAWHRRLHRVIVVDADVAGTTASAAVEDLQKTAGSSTVLGPSEIADVLTEAIAQADRSASTRRTELVLVWTGSRAAVTASDISDIPARVGVRLVIVDDVTRSSVRTASTASNGRVAIETDDRELQRSLRADLEALRLPPSATPIRVRWAGEAVTRGTDGSAECPGGRERVLRALDEMSADARVREAADRSLRGEGRAVDDGGHAPTKVLARSATGDVLLRGWADDGCLVLDLDSIPRSPLTWWSLVSAREALARIDRLGPVERWTATEVANASREGRVPTASPLPGGLDTRTAWGVALALLLVEQWWRRRREPPPKRDVSAPPRAAPRERVDAV